MSGPRTESGDIEALVRGSAPGCRVRRDGAWVVVHPPGAPIAEHGWKLHVSARATTFVPVLRRLLPVLRDEGCVFKAARSTGVLIELNDGITAPASVGKAVTIYPRPDRFRALGLALVALLRGYDGPRVVGDRRIDAAAPVFYRYGPFTAGWRATGSGRIGMVIRGPGGEEFDGEADGRGYRQPSWVTDPFPDAVCPLPDAELVLGGRYAVTEGIVASGRGNVYRAVDREAGDLLVIKQARALVAEADDGVDTRMRLRNERRILPVLAGIAGVPRFVDHFAHADDEYLVITDEGATNLREDLHQRGPYPLGSVRRLARDLATILHAVHGRGVVMRDVKPDNVIVHADGPRLVDFGIAGYDGLHLRGGTSGYAPERQRADEPPRPADDLYALGMTLIEALTGLPPVHRVSTEHARTKALETVRSRWGAAPDGVVGAVVDLLHDDPAIAEVALHYLRTGTTDHITALPLPPAPDVTAELTGVLLDQLTVKIDAPSGGRAKPNPTLYSGLAGAGRELLRHDGSRDRVTRLVDQVTEQADAVDLGPGLLSGRTGVNLFLREARDWLGLPDPGRDRPEVPGEFDLVSGTAGIGLGHAWFHRRDQDQRDRDVVRRCADALATAAPDKPGLAHGLAGVVLFELVAEDEVDRERADARLDALIDKAPALIARANAGDGTELRVASWCNGLTGVGRVLAEAGRRRDRPDCTRLAMAAGDALAGWIPRSINLGQCCGVAGIGDFLLDLATLPGGERFAEYAHAAARHILLRSAGTHARPEPVSFSSTDPDGISWAIGLGGLLGFVRRLREHGRFCTERSHRPPGFCTSAV